MNKMIVEVVYAEDAVQHLLAVEVPENSTIAEVISLSGILQLFPGIDLTKQGVGVFSKIRTLDDNVEQGDRIEIYRPLKIEPKDARRLRAKKNNRKAANNGKR